MASPVESGSHEELFNMDNEPVLKTGHLYKQGGSYRSWKRRYFVLYETFLSYYAKKGDSTPKGNIDLTIGLGIRSRDQLCDELQWPKQAKTSLSFGIATEERTFFLYGESQPAVKDWMTLIQKCINKIGQPNEDYKNDPACKPESNLYKVMKGGAKLASMMAEMMLGNGDDDEEEEEPVDCTTDDNARLLSDHLTVNAADDSSGTVGDDMDIRTTAQTSMATQGFKTQRDISDDTSFQKRLYMGDGTARQETGKGLFERRRNNDQMIEHDEPESEADEELGLTLSEESAIESMSLSQAIGEALGEEFQPIVDALSRSQNRSADGLGEVRLTRARGIRRHKGIVKQTHRLREQSDMYLMAPPVHVAH